MGIFVRAALGIQSAPLVLLPYGICPYKMCEITSVSADYTQYVICAIYCTKALIIL